MSDTPLNDATTPNAPPGPDDRYRRIGDYVILRLLGEGGMGSVYLAEDARLGRKAAVKTMRPELAAEPADRDRFLREARAAAAVEHDHIVPIWQVGEAADGSPFLAMPFLQGESLDARLRREPVAAVGAVAEGRAARSPRGWPRRHAAGLIHRDIKPANVWLEGDPPRRTRPAGAAVQAPRLRAGPVASAERRAPDGQRGDRRHAGVHGPRAGPRASGWTTAADLFSLGVLLYRMATGGCRSPGRTDGRADRAGDGRPPPAGAR